MQIRLIVALAPTGCLMLICFNYGNARMRLGSVSANSINADAIPNTRGENSASHDLELVDAGWREHV